MLSDLAIALLQMPDFWDRFSAIQVESNRDGSPALKLERSLSKPMLIVRVTDSKFTVRVQYTGTIECELNISSVLEVICTN
jgi:hypothetical protein